MLLGIGKSGGRVTMIGNLLAHQVERNPLARSRELVFVNNLVYDRANMDLDIQTDDGRVDQELDRRQRVPARARATRDTTPIYVRTGRLLPRWFSGCRALRQRQLRAGIRQLDVADSCR